MPKLKRKYSEIQQDRFNGFVTNSLRQSKTKTQELADFMELPLQSVNARLRGATKWTLEDMSKACEFIGEPFTIGEKK